MANLLATVATIITQTNAPTLPHHVVRLQELNLGLSGLSPIGHEHEAGDIQDLQGYIFLLLADALGDSTTIRFRERSLLTDPFVPEVVLISGGGLIETEDGIAVDFTRVAAENHTHDDLHPAAALDLPSCLGITGTLGLDQLLALEIVLASNSGLTLGASGLGLDFGTGHDQASRGDHEHDQLHDPVTVLSSLSLRLNISGDQLLSGVVELDPAPSSGRGRLGVAAAGLHVVLGTTADTAAAGNHAHAAASSAADGFLSAADKRKLDSYAALLQEDQSALFHRHDELQAGEYVGGRHLWGQAMQIVRVHFTASAPTVECRLGIEVDGTVTDTFAVPAGSIDAEVADLVALNNLYVPADTFVRIIGISGVGVVEEEPSRLNVVLMVRPAVASAPTVRINAGGLEATPFGTDQSYAGGSAGSTTGACDTVGVTDPAPQAVYKSWRSSAEYFIYTITGLARGIDYLVRLHFNQSAHDAEGEALMDIKVTGATITTVKDYDIIEEAGAKNTAVVREFTVQADNNGQIAVRFDDAGGTTVGAHAQVSGLEFIPQV